MHPSRAADRSPGWVRLLLLLSASSIPTVLAEGRGLIGWGKNMYDPPCAFACRSVISGCTLLCTPMMEGGDDSGMGHMMSDTPPECYTTDNAFLRTMALCIYSNCPGSDAPLPGKIENYWDSHLGTGSIGDYSFKPSISYSEALLAARDDAQNALASARSGSSSNGTSTGTNSTSHSGHGTRSLRGLLRVRHHNTSLAEGTIDVSALPMIMSGDPLNVTSVVDHDEWLAEYNGEFVFEQNENGHSTYGLTLLFVSLFLPILLSLFRFIPGITRSRTWTWINSAANHPPAFGISYRAPLSSKILGGGIVPTRGQTLYIVLIFILTLIFLLAPYLYLSPNSWFPTRLEQDLDTVGNRAGNMAMVFATNSVVFAARNSPLLLYLTDWSHGTFLLLHRWHGYMSILLSVLHTLMLFSYYYIYRDYPAESTELYWIYGALSTVAAVAIWPASVLAVRKYAYEVFLSTHHVLVVLFLVGYYYHIWYLFTYDWGYEIWVWIIVGLWVVDRLWRIGRMAMNGWRTARVSSVEGANGGDYLRIEIDGVHAEGVVYLNFPTLRWMFWENHPFSVASSFVALGDGKPVIEKLTDKTQKAVTIDATTDTVTEKPPVQEAQAVVPSKAPSSTTPSTHIPRASFVIRVRRGVTSQLASRLASSPLSSITLPVLIEGSYPSAPHDQLAHCTTLLCIAGGVGVTAVFPLIHHFVSVPTRRARLVWGVRNNDLPTLLAPELASLPSFVDVETSVGKRVDVAAVVSDEVMNYSNGEGPIGVVVCGPPGMADHVREMVAEVGRTGRRAIVFVDEGFSW